MSSPSAPPLADAARESAPVTCPPPSPPVGPTAHADQPLAVGDFGVLLLQLALCGLIAWRFELDGTHFLWQALALAAAGFAVHAWLPASFRAPWFLFVSAAAIVLMTGFSGAAAIFGIGGGLIVIASLPLPFWSRVNLLLLAAALLILLHNEYPRDFWVLLGSMFMFRLLVYMFTVRQERVPAGFFQRMSYFFLMPNAFWGLFPVVDYKTFCSSWYTDERRKIYQTGVHWIALGIAHLLIYRWLKYFVVPSPFTIQSSRGVLLYLASNYGLYLQISGIFHIICGMLHLYGYNLPRTHDHYFLASSFSDIWRRINIYWKDFMTKVFFFPSFFELRSAGTALAVLLSVINVFFWTWLAHSWQRYWVSGHFLFALDDAVLWLGVGLLVAGNSLLDYRRNLKRKKGGRSFSFARATIHMLKIIGVFSCVAVFWARWSSHPDILKMLYFLFGKYGFTARDVFWIGGSLLAFIAIGVAVQAVRSRLRSGQTDSLLAALLGKGQVDFQKSAVLHLAPLSLLIVLAQPQLYENLPLSPELVRDFRKMQQEQVAFGDALANIDGYYEQLNAQALQGSPFLQPPRDPHQERFRDQFQSMTRTRNDILQLELIPGWSGLFNDQLTTVNRWGMRDRPDLTLTRSAGTKRIAFLGTSVVMGLGVADERTITRQLEDRLNSDRNGPRYQLLNFGVGRYYAIHRRAQIEKMVLGFQPDLIVYVLHQDELFHTSDWLQGAFWLRVPFEDPCLEELVFEKLGLTHKMSEFEVVYQLQKHLEEILRCTYQRIAEISRDSGVPIVFAYLPIPDPREPPSDPRVVLEFARDYGIDVIDLDNWWEGYSRDQLIAKFDQVHPNEFGSGVIADAFLEAWPQIEAQIGQRSRATD